MTGTSCQTSPIWRIPGEFHAVLRARGSTSPTRKHYGAQSVRLHRLEDTALKPSWPTRAFMALAEALDRTIGWDKLPKPLGILTLAGLREKLRSENLYDTGRGPADKPPFVDPDQPFAYLTSRTVDGTYNDLRSPLMGALGSRFGRNVPLEDAYPDPPERLLDPNPRLVSRRLLTRDTFQPASSLNLLAAAWIQFEVHDWFNHGKNAPDDPWLLPLEADDPWP